MANSNLLCCLRGVAACKKCAAFRLKLGTTNTRAEVRSTAFKRNRSKWKPQVFAKPNLHSPGLRSGPLISEKNLFICKTQSEVNITDLMGLP